VALDINLFHFSFHFSGFNAILLSSMLDCGLEVAAIRFYRISKKT